MDRSRKRPLYSKSYLQRNQGRNNVSYSDRDLDTLGKEDGLTISLNDYKITDNMSIDLEEANILNKNSIDVSVAEQTDEIKIPAKRKSAFERLGDEYNYRVNKQERSLLHNLGRETLSYADVDSSLLPEEDGLKMSSQTYVNQDTVTGKTLYNLYLAPEEIMLSNINEQTIRKSVTEHNRKSVFERLGSKYHYHVDKQEPSYSSERIQKRKTVSDASMDSDTFLEGDRRKISLKTCKDPESGNTSSNMSLASKSILVTVPNKKEIDSSVSNNKADVDKTNKTKSVFEQVGIKNHCRGKKHEITRVSTSVADSLKEISYKTADDKTSSNKSTLNESDYSQSREKSTSNQLSDTHQGENCNTASSRVSKDDSRQNIMNQNTKEKRNKFYNNRKRSFFETMRHSLSGSRSLQEKLQHSEDIQISQTKRARTENSKHKGTRNMLEHSVAHIDPIILSEMNADELADYLAINQKDFSAFVRKESNIENIDLFIQILGRLCESQNICSVKMALFPIKERFFERTDVKKVIVELRPAMTGSCDAGKFSILRNMLVLMKTLSQHLSCGPTDLPLDSLELCTITMKEGALQEKARELIEGIRQNWEKQLSDTKSTLLILPYLSDIETFQHSVVNEKYINETEYLKRLFLVHRQDFWRPLCRGLICLRNDLRRDPHCLKKMWKNKDVRVYKDVQLLTKCCNLQDGVTWKVGFYCTPYRKINYSMRKLLSYGSLVCLTNKTFTFIYFATVSERKPEDLRMGAFDIKLLKSESDNDNLNNDELILIESQAFFPSYFHTLESLKNMHSKIQNNNRRLPFGKQIVSLCDFSEKADYVDSELFKERGFDMSFFGSGLGCINNTDKLHLMHAAMFGMDESQYSAFDHAIKSKLSIIQGPPGTGKTVVGLKIAELLLRNTQIWRPDKNKGPMLLLIYTNNALDQFLVNISKRISTLCQQDIVRIGTRSNVEGLQNFNLSSQRADRDTYDISDFREITTTYKMRAHDAKYKLRIIKKEYDQLRNLKHRLLTGIVHEDWFYRFDFMDEKDYYQIKNSGGILLWLKVRNLKISNISSIKQTADKNMFCEDEFDDYEYFDAQLNLHDIYDEIEDTDDRHLTMNTGLNFENLKMVLSSEMICSQSNEKHSKNFWEKYNDDDRNMLLQAIELKLSSTKEMSSAEACSVNDIWDLSDEYRWKLYKCWLCKAMYAVEQKILKCEKTFERAHSHYKNVQFVADTKILQNAKLIACTTTRAARDIEILKRVAPTIIILEEAAEIPEHHVVSCLTSSCQQLIMIGDQQQLRPKYNDYQTAKEHKINISLFERLIEANFPYKRLNNQHRMRPEISKLLVPHIYASLHDDESVKEYSNILGMKHNVYFISHDKFEDNEREDASKSHKNTHEAVFIVALYRYLRMQGYLESHITILSPYLDQVRLLRTLIRPIDVEIAEKFSLPHFNLCDNTPVPGDKTTEQRNGVRITTVDNFQGEENDIILLSLVRSNESGIIGHLSEANRICVALSRAKKGLYVIGNFELLKTKSTVWEAILEDSRSRGFFGTSLQLSCQNHSTSTNVSTDNDFLLVQDGGCQSDCNFKRPCGHKCARKCHADDKDHNPERCIKLCNELCDRKLHRCQEKCHYFEKCKPCKEKITKKIPECQHDNLMPCYKDPNLASCTERCSVIISCGHRCQKHCTDLCSTEENCNELIKTTCPSGHEVQVACCKKYDPPCKIPCNEILKCGHNCSGNCFECRRGRLHVPCKQKCDKTLVCGHICSEKCNYTCPPCKAACVRSCGHQDKCQKPCGEPCIKCRELCNWTCSTKCPNGFVCSNLCHEPCDRPKCNTPCNRKLKKCGHTCPGLLCEKCIDICRICEKEKLTEIFFGSEDEIGAVFIQLDDCKCVYEVSGLDTHIDTKIEDLKNKNEIVYLKCMKCSIKITNSNRYRNELRILNIHIDNVYKTVRRMEEAENTSSKKHRVMLLLKESEEYTNEKDLKYFTNKANRARTIVQFNLIADQLTFLKQIKFLKDNASSMKDNHVVHAGLTELYNWVCRQRTRFAEQELDEFALETRRLHLEIDITKFIKDVTQHKSETERVPMEIQNYLITLQSAVKINDSEISNMRKNLHASVSKILGISLQEKKMIKRAMEIELKGSGHWYTCANGHYYCIGECGMPMVEIKCPYCNVTIGGTNHLLLDQNDRAMDMETLVTDNV